ncbi:MAG: hypothetical protein JNL88_04670 [Bacteroidia bacterium]|nr:hypothetical protein [Bacteroidia bacterium]
MEIATNLNNPRQLEKMYRENKAAFKAEFNRLYPELKHEQVAEFWHERLNFENREISWGSTRELSIAIVAALVAGLLAQLPLLLGINPEDFYARNIGFIIFPILTAHFIRKNKLSIRKSLFVLLATLASLIYINQLPEIKNSDSILLACIHLPLLLWALLGFCYTGEAINKLQKRLEFLRYNGDLLIMSGLILIAGVALSGITMMLFSAIGYDIEKFYGDYIVVSGLAAIPVLGTYITQSNPQLVHKVSPVLAKLFSPLVLIMLLIYLSAILYSGKNPYMDREFLMVFNLMLIGVMAIVLFSLAETSRQEYAKGGSMILFALSLVTILVNGIALSAILFRISAWGLTPNRLAVSGANLLMLSNLCLIAYRLYRHFRHKAAISEAAQSISLFLPLYFMWTVFVIFILPLLYSFK